MSSNSSPLLTIENLRLHLFAVRDQGRAKLAEEGIKTPSREAGNVIAQLLIQRLTTEKVIQTQLWRERLISPDGSCGSTLCVRLSWQRNEDFQLYLADDPQVEILFIPPEPIKVLSDIIMNIDLNGSENEAWMPLRSWGAEFFPDPYQEDKDWKATSPR